MSTADPGAEELSLAADTDLSEGTIEETGSDDSPLNPPIVTPIPPIGLAKRQVSGRYRGVNGSWELELRVDVDGVRPMKRVSGDFFKVAGGTKTYYGSWVVDAASISLTSSLVTITGTGSYTYSTAFPKVKVTIPRVTVFSPAQPATITFMTAANAPGATYVCKFESSLFRTLQYEQDRVSTATLFANYNTGTLPSGGPARDLTVVKAFAEAGIEVQTTSASNVVPVPAGVGATWDNSELHASMVSHFSLWADQIGWKVWLFATTAHTEPGVRGIMFDQQGKQRQGCAIFHDLVGGSSPEVQRAMLRTYVHELGHCFNLMHSFHKSFSVPPIPNRLAAKSWMNYVQNYPGGAAAYWADFPFQFDDEEVVHLRHGFRNNVIMGGNAFGTGAAEIEASTFDAPEVDNSGLELEIAASRSFAQGEPVVVELRLTNRSGLMKQVHQSVHPKSGTVQLGIAAPGGAVLGYEPMVWECNEEVLALAPGASVESSAYVGYGRRGFYFEQPGIYEVRAVYSAVDGSRVVSNVAKLRVRAPSEQADEELADLFLGDETGQLLFLLGSDSPTLARGNEALDVVLDKFGSDPLADYARLVKGVNAAREFKTLTADNELRVRDARVDESVKLLEQVADPGAGGTNVDRITRNMAAAVLAEVSEGQVAPKKAKGRK